MFSAQEILDCFSPNVQRHPDMAESLLSSSTLQFPISNSPLSAIEESILASSSINAVKRNFKPKNEDDQKRPIVSSRGGKRPVIPREKEDSSIPAVDGKTSFENIQVSEKTPKTTLSEPNALNRSQEQKAPVSPSNSTSGVIQQDLNFPSVIRTMSSQNINSFESSLASSQPLSNTFVPSKPQSTALNTIGNFHLSNTSTFVPDSRVSTIQNTPINNSNLFSHPVPVTYQEPPKPKSVWYYTDPSSKIQGPFSYVQMREWNNQGYFLPELPVRKDSGLFYPLKTLLTKYPDLFDDTSTWDGVLDNFDNLMGNLKISPSGSANFNASEDGPALRLNQSISVAPKAPSFVDLGNSYIKEAFPSVNTKHQEANIVHMIHASPSILHSDLPRFSDNLNAPANNLASKDSGTLSGFRNNMIPISSNTIPTQFSQIHRENLLTQNFATGPLRDNSLAQLGLKDLPNLLHQPYNASDLRDPMIRPYNMYSSNFNQGNNTHLNVNPSLGNSQNVVNMQPSTSFFQRPALDNELVNKKPLNHFSPESAYSNSSVMQASPMHFSTPQKSSTETNIIVHKVSSGEPNTEFAKETLHSLASTSNNAESESVQPDEKKKKTKKKKTKLLLDEPIPAVASTTAPIAEAVVSPVKEAWAGVEVKKLSFKEIQDSENKLAQVRKSKIEQITQARVIAEANTLRQNSIAEANALRQSSILHSKPAWSTPIAPIIAASLPPALQAKNVSEPPKETWNSVGKNKPPTPPKAASAELLVWCRQALKAMERNPTISSVKIDYFVQMLMEIPLSETETLLTICDDTLGGLTAIDPRKFGLEFLKRRREGNSAVSNVPSKKKEENNLKAFETSNSFVVVKKKGK